MKASLEAAARQYAHGAVKVQEDLDRYDHVLRGHHYHEKGVVVELGTFSGKAAWWFSWRASHVVTVDTNPPDAEVLAAEAGCGISWILGDTTAQTIVDRVHELVSGAPALVSIDSDHSRSHVLKEMLLYADLVQPGGHMVVEDTLLRWMPEDEKRHYVGTPMDAVEEFLASHPDWQVDDEVEDVHPVTQHPGGWLRRLG